MRGGVVEVDSAGEGKVRAQGGGSLREGVGVGDRGVGDGDRGD